MGAPTNVCDTLRLRQTLRHLAQGTSDLGDWRAPREHFRVGEWRSRLELKHFGDYLSSYSVLVFWYCFTVVWIFDDARCER